MRGTVAVRDGHMRPVSSQGGDRPEVYAGNGSHGIPAYGFRTCGQGMGIPKDPAAGITGALDVKKKGGVKVVVDVMEVGKTWDEINETPA